MIHPRKGRTYSAPYRGYEYVPLRFGGGGGGGGVVQGGGGVVQGGESRDCTSIRTEGVRKLFIIFLILIECSCSKVEIPCLCSQRWNIYAILCYSMFDIMLFEQRMKVFARACVEKYRVRENGSYQMTCCCSDKVSALHRAKIH